MINSQIRKIAGFLKNMLLFFLIYLFIFSPRMNFGFSLHAGLFAVALVCLFGWKFVVSAIATRSVIFAIFTFIFIAVFHWSMALLYDNDSTYFVSIQTSLILYILFSFSLTGIMVKNNNLIEFKHESLIDKLIQFSAFAIFANSLIILFEYLNPDIKMHVESLLLSDPEANINYSEHAFRLRGFSSAGGAGLSIVNALGVLFFIFLMMNGLTTRWVALICSLTITLSNIFTGRTGLIFSVIFILISLIFITRQLMLENWRGGVQAIGLALLLAFFINFILGFELDPAAAAWAFEWSDGLMSGSIESSSAEELKSMLFLPDNLLHLLSGIGFFEGSNDYYPRTDSGYLKTILSIGIPLGFFLYISIAMLFANICKVSKKYRLLTASVLGFMLIVEIKEPFLYQNYAARVLFLLSGAALFVLNRRPAC